MTENIRRAVIHEISEASSLSVYGQRVPQGAKLPCFTVELAGMKQKQLLGKRAERTAVFEVCYFCGEEKTAAEESTLAVDRLYEALLIIGEDEKFAASGMKHEKTADGVKFTVEYEYHIIFTEEEAEKMERLKYNGKEAVGYEEIQQRAAE